LETLGTGRSQAILKAAPGYKKRILLTGTPIRNHPYELAPLAHTIDPGDNTLPLDPKAFNAKFIAQEKVDPGFLKRYFLGVKPGVREKSAEPAGHPHEREARGRLADGPRLLLRPRRAAHHP